jgi:hypothetical protein
MKRYTLRTLIHDLKVLNQLRSEYRRGRNDRRKEAGSDWLSRYFAGTSKRVEA